MTIQCSRCKKIMGEKCGKCGSREAKKKTTLKGREYWHCLACGWFWTPGMEGVTHSICDDCSKTSG